MFFFAIDGTTAERRFFWLNDVLQEKLAHQKRSDVFRLNDVLLGKSAHQRFYCIISESTFAKDIDVFLTLFFTRKISAPEAERRF